MNAKGDGRMTAVKTLVLIIMFFATLALCTACRTVETRTEVVTVTQVEYVYPSDELLKPCPEVAPFEFSTNGELLMSLIQLTTDYAVCSARMQGVISYVETIKQTTKPQSDTAVTEQDDKEALTEQN